MARAGGFVLHLTSERRDVFNRAVTLGEPFAEPVPEFAHSKTAPLVCFVVLDGTHIGHLGQGRRGVVSGTDLRRLNLHDIYTLANPIPIGKIVEELNSKTKAKATATLTKGGAFSPKAFENAVEAIQKVSPECSPLIERFGQARRDLIRKLSPEVRAALAAEKEAVLAALSIANMDRRHLHDWVPPSDGVPGSFLDGLPNAVMREDAMVVNDLINVPGFQFIRTLPYSAAIFESNGIRLTVLLANRLPLEQLSGADLIYFNENHRSFVMVQYKAMENDDNGPIFRLPNAGLSKEIDRMK